MSISTPPVNAGLKYTNGFQLAYASTTTITVQAGLARDSSNSNDISMGLPLPVAATQTGVEPVAAGTGALTVSTALNGAGGLDTGTIANSTFYGVYAIGDSSSINPGSVVLSANLSAPLMPSGYNMYHRIGCIKTDGSAHILSFRQEGSGFDRWMWYDVAIATNITAGTSATFAAVDCSAGIPALSHGSLANFLCLFTPTAAGNTLELRPGDSSATNGYARQSGSVAAVANTVNMVCPYQSTATAAIDYLVTGTAVAISVAGYLDNLDYIAAMVD